MGKSSRKGIYQFGIERHATLGRCVGLIIQGPEPGGRLLYLDGARQLAAWEAISNRVRRGRRGVGVSRLWACHRKGYFEL